MHLLDRTIAAIGVVDSGAMRKAEVRQGQLTKPPGALGVLEHLSIQLCGIAGRCPPPVPEPAAVAVFAADHGVHAQGVTPWPQEVTAQMVGSFAAGGAAVSVLARRAGAAVVVVDVGVAGDVGTAPGVLVRKVRRGTRDLMVEPAMTRQEAEQAVGIGIGVAMDLCAAGHRCLLTGDMGIANTTASSALIAAFTGASPTETTGPGTGVSETVWRRKVGVVEAALSARPPGDNPLETLASLGGLEHAALAGFVLGGAACRVPVILDGVIAGAAALAVQALAPVAIGYCVAGHRSAEPGHALALATLGLRPLVDLDLRLGEGSGAVLALPLVQSSALVLREMATFESAGISGNAQSTEGAP